MILPDEDKYRKFHAPNASDIAWNKAREYLDFCDSWGGSIGDLATTIQEAIDATAKEKLLTEALATEEGRKQLAQSMSEPIRCGGVEYHQGVPYISLGGVEYPYKEFHDAHEANGWQFPEEWCKAYRESQKTDRYGHNWQNRGTCICPHVCKNCGALSGTDDAFIDCKEVKARIEAGNIIENDPT